jgi:flagellar biosynthesis regulator FlaF
MATEDETGDTEPTGSARGEIENRTSALAREVEKFHEVATPRITAEIPREDYEAFKGLFEKRALEEKVDSAAKMASVLERTISEFRARKRPGTDWRSVSDEEFRKADEARRQQRHEVAVARAKARVDATKEADSTLAKEIDAITGGRGIWELSDKEFSALEKKKDSVRRQRMIAQGTLATQRIRPR